MKKFAETALYSGHRNHNTNYQASEKNNELKDIRPHHRFYTAYGSVDTAVMAMKLGADEFFEKPVDLPLLLQKIEQLEQQAAVDQDVARVEETLEESELPLKIIAGSPGMKEVLSVVRRVAESSFAVLIRGETGTGKELVARLLHLLSARRDSNSASVPLAQATASRVRHRPAIAHSNSPTAGPMMNRCDSITADSAGKISSRIVSYWALRSSKGIGM